MHRSADVPLRRFALLAARPGMKAVVVLTDGMDTTSDISQHAMWQHLAARNVRVYTIGLGQTLSLLSKSHGSSGVALLDLIARFFDPTEGNIAVCKLCVFFT